MKKKMFLFLVMALFFIGCSTTQSVRKLEGSGSKRVYNASYEKVWSAAIVACQSETIQIEKSDKEEGQISAKTKVRATSWGENISVWVRKLNADSTEVEVVSRKAGPAIFFHYNWEESILNNIESQL